MDRSTPGNNFINEGFFSGIHRYVAGRAAKETV